MGGLRPSGLHLNKPVVFGLLGTVLIVFILSRLYMGGGLNMGGGLVVAGLGQIGKSAGAGRGPEVESPAKPKMDDMVNASQLDTLPALPADGVLDTKEEQFKVTMGDKTLSVHVVQAINNKVDISNALTVFFLHGAKFSSQNWVDIHTLEHVANWGYRAIAIDLPGKGKTTDTIDPSENAEFLAAFIKAFKMTDIVIVSPSMSGGYALPYLFKEPKTSMERAKGYVPVAPVSTNEYTKQYPESQIPTLIVYGRKDLMGATTLNDLILLPNHEIAPIDDAGHACYLDQPDAFHKVLYHFLKGLRS